ncbi:MAG: DNA cytosine methyltransferase [Bacteroidales bacterium]|nr:DNA cytosine methyltransferase [Candidatus Scybalousia scybalohippi]
MRVLSLFDGISCGMVALERADLKVDEYLSSEIEPSAIAISEKNYPNIKRLGDVNNWKNWEIDWSKIDLLIGGSPCQGFSIMGKQLNFDDPRSSLFLVYVDILEHIKKFNSKVKFLLENVNMKKEYVKVISDFLGVEPVRIDSRLVAAAQRDRLYWANFEITQPRDKHITFDTINTHTHMAG